MLKITEKSSRNKVSNGNSEYTFEVKSRPSLYSLIDKEWLTSRQNTASNDLLVHNSSYKQSESFVKANSNRSMNWSDSSINNSSRLPNLTKYNKKFL